MEVIRAWQSEGETISAPYERHIKVMLAPDVNDVPELMYTYAIIYPHSSTDLHSHDRPELIQILSGRGYAECDGETVEIEPDMALWVRAGEEHRVVNTGPETLKLATVFVPGYTKEQNLQRIREAAKNAQ